MAGTTLFVYGTLRNARLVRELTGVVFASRPACLPDHERVMPSRGFPYVFPRVGATVDGLLLGEIDATSLQRLDAYEEEGVLYLRRPVTAIAAGAPVVCQTYLGNLPVLRARYG